MDWPARWPQFHAVWLSVMTLSRQFMQINTINGKRIHLLVPDRGEYVRSYKM